MTNYYFWLEDVDGNMVRSDRIIRYVAPVRYIDENGNWTEPIRCMGTMGILDNDGDSVVAFHNELSPLKFVATLHFIVERFDDYYLPNIITQDMIDSVPDVQSIISSFSERLREN